jgi:uncharacterized protein YqeY
VSLQETIEAELHTAMKARDALRTSALRMVIAAFKNRAVADGLGPQGRLDDAVVQQLLATEVKRRREAALAFREAGHEDRAASEEQEAAVYEAYLPAPLPDDELAALVAAVVTETGATSMKDMGTVMRTVLERAQGRADGSRVSPLVKAALDG